MSKYVSQKRIVFIVHVVVTALLFFVIIFFWINNPDFTPKILRENNVDNKFTNPILDCENINPGNDSILSISSLENKVAAVQKKYNVTFVSLYFRDLNDGQWIGVNEKEYFSPASLLKTPLLIAFLKHAESEENLLTKKITIQNSDIGTALKQNVVSPSSLIIGNTYSLLEIAEIMIQKSNNDAANIILKYVPEKDIAAVFHYVGVPYKNERQEQNVRVKDYAGFFVFFIMHLI